MLRPGQGAGKPADPKAQAGACYWREAGRFGTYRERPPDLPEGACLAPEPEWLG
jgi:hypothetical protein